MGEADWRYMQGAERRCLCVVEGDGHRCFLETLLHFSHLRREREGAARQRLSLDYAANESRSNDEERRPFSSPNPKPEMKGCE